MGSQKGGRKGKGTDDGWSEKEEWVEWLKNKMEQQWEKRLNELCNNMLEQISAESKKWESRAVVAEAKIQRLEEEMDVLKQDLKMRSKRSKMTEMGTSAGSEGTEGGDGSKQSFAAVISGHHGVWEMIRETAKEMLKSDPEIQKEKKWEEERERSIIIHGLQEAEGQTYDERKHWEKTEIKNIIAITG
nr:uncharacterized protein LOC128691284 [Cherax quadricarinatus]